MNKLRTSLQIVYGVVFLLIPLIWVASAYATNLGTLGIIDTTGNFQTKIDPKAKPGDMDIFVTDEPILTTEPSPELKRKLIPHSEAFLTHWLTAVNKNPHRLLWSSYPASIRGQVFSGKAAGGDPMTAGGW